MNKSFLIVTFSHLRCCPQLRRNSLGFVAFAIGGLIVAGTLSPAVAQDTADAKAKNDAPVAEPQPKASEPQPKSAPAYPLAVAVSGNDVYTVDLDLPGVWKTGDATVLFAEGTKLLRKPMNRPRCVAIHPEKGILVGDTATREIYWIESEGAEPKPLTNGYLGVVMALAVSPDGKTLYAGDAEKRATFKLPVEGGKPELVARVNARGLAFDSDGKLWAVTPDAAAVKRIDVASGDVEDIVTGRPFQYPNGLCWAGDHGYVTDGYGKCIWKFTPDGKTEKWHEGEPLVGPVGIALTDKSIFVADPKQKEVYEFDRESKTPKSRLAPAAK
ncbi:MAG: hypothetical protein ACR2OA_05485 [Rubripirellula sp.]